MTPGILLVGLATVMAPEPTSAADSVTLRDGTVVLGQVVEPAPRGTLRLLVRRAWAQGHLPDWARRWQEAEAPRVERARIQRRERLSAWQRGRRPDPGRDPIGAWIDAELARLAGDDAPPPLMLVPLPRGEVKAVARRPKELGRQLRQGWLEGIAEVETMTPEDLTSALEARGYAIGGTDLPAIDALLPIPEETDTRWQVRRAATEVQFDRGLWYLRHGEQLVLPEGEPGAPADATTALAAVQALLQDEPGDPLQAPFRASESKGRVGLVVTRLDTAPDASGVRVEITLWVRSGAGRWAPAGSTRAAVSVAEIPPGAMDRVADDPQVQAVFRSFQALGLGAAGEEVRRSALRIGVATQRALSQARSAFDRELEATALPIAAAPRRPPRPAPGP
jgi:hypothetical protein